MSAALKISVYASFIICLCCASVHMQVYKMYCMVKLAKHLFQIKCRNWGKIALGSGYFTNILHCTSIQTQYWLFRVCGVGVRLKWKVFMWLGARTSWPLKDIWPVELTIPRYYQRKTLQLRLTNGEVMTHDFWHKRATQSVRSRRHIFQRRMLLPTSKSLCALWSWGTGVVLDCFS